MTTIGMVETKKMNVTRRKNCGDKLSGDEKTVPNGRSNRQLTI